MTHLTRKLIYIILLILTRKPGQFMPAVVGNPANERVNVWYGNTIFRVEHPLPPRTHVFDRNG